MSSADNKEWILHVIDQLRRRKARPDMERICHFVQRKYGLSRAETECNVEKLVDAGAIVKVHYKRGTSYRNAAKARKRIYSTQILNSNNVSRKIQEAVQSIVKEKSEKTTSPEDTSAYSDGVSVCEIETWLSARNETPEQEPVMCPMHFVLQREVEAGRLTKLHNGNYDLAKEPPREMACSPKKLIFKSYSVESFSVVSKRGRPPKKKQVSRSVSCGDVLPVTVAAPRVPPAPQLCDFCQQTAASNRAGQPEDLLICKDCSAKAHPSCMEYSPELARRARNSPWQCIDCKTCCICFDPGDADSMLFCDACDKGYHMLCHEPNVEDKPQGKWVCSSCVVEGISADDIEATQAPDLPSPASETPETPGNPDLKPSFDVDRTTRKESSSDGRMLSASDDLASRNSSTLEEHLPEKPAKKIKVETTTSYPYAAYWTTNEVVKFFQEKGFSDQAEVFREQEIDGQSLLLMRRSDVLQGLSLKLGPALKMYKHVTKLQTAKKA